MKTFSRLIVLVALSGAVVFGQTPATGRVMREKLGHSQKILEAILTSNFPLLDGRERGSESGQILACARMDRPQGPGVSEAEPGVSEGAWGTPRPPPKIEDLDAAALRYNALTTSCFGCHRFMKDRRLADR